MSFKLLNLLGCEDFSNKQQQFQSIENESIISRVFNDLSISGSLFHNSIFENVIFEDCMFFSCKLQETRFVNCKFINCKFQFSQLHTVDFSACFWMNTEFSNSISKDCLLSFNQVDVKSIHQFSQEESNGLEHCFVTDREIQILE